jgi:hypothetical protein
LTYHTQDVDSGPDRPASDSETEIKITPEMIERGLEFFDKSPINSLTTVASHPEFVESLLRFIINGG